jgi:hypothetical protein
MNLLLHKRKKTRALKGRRKQERKKKNPQKKVKRKNNMEFLNFFPKTHLHLKRG